MVTRIITLSNKPSYLPDAVASVAAQTRRDLVHVVRMDTYRTWGGKYPPAVYWNEMSREAAIGDYVCWLSDDDLLLPNYVADLAGHLDAHPEIECVYGGSTHVIHEPPNPDRVIRNLPPQWPFPLLNMDHTPGYQIDGGQFMIRRSALERIPYPWCPEAAEGAGVCDASYMNKIVWYLAMFPVQTFVMINRATPLSSHAVVVKGHIEVASWLRLHA
jgi:GT2 family glycosyltransferase